MKRFDKAVLFLGAFFLALSIVLYVFSKWNNSYLVLFHWVCEGSLFVIFIFALLACINILALRFLCVWFLERRHSALVPVALAVFAVDWLAVPVLLFYGGLTFNATCTVLNTPDNTHQIIVTRQDVLTNSFGGFYEMTGGLFAEEIGGYYVEHGFQAFRKGRYTIEWYSDGFLAIYQDGVSENSTRSERVYFLGKEPKD